MATLEQRIDPDRIREILVGVVRIAWQVFRLPVLALFVILEPVIGFLLSVSALLLTLCAIFFKFVVHRADFPFVMMLGFSIGCIFTLALYHGAIRVLSTR